MMKANNIKRNCLALLAALLFPMMMFADPQEKGLAEADKAYSEGKYQEAMAIYISALEMEGVSAPALFNLGNICVKAGEMGKAALCYERAHRLDPGNKEIVNNLEYVRTKVEDSNRSELKGKNLSVQPDAPSFFMALYNNVTTDTSSNFWAELAAIAFILTLASVAVYIFASNVVAKKTGFFGSIGCLVFCIVFLIFAFRAGAHYNSEDEGIITAYKIELREEPGEKSKASTTPLCRGTKLDVLDSEVNSKGEITWYKVRLNSDFKGWIPAGDFEII